MGRIPAFHDPERVGTLFHPDVGAIAADAERAGLSPATEDSHRILLLLVDMQVDFCHQGGSLYVPGAEDDIRRVINFIYDYADRISHITCSLDSHYPLQIFQPAWWTDAQGRRPEPFTVVTLEDVEEGKWKPTLEPEWSRAYVKKLRQQAKKDLVVWPYHVPIGGIGNALDPELWSAVFWHSIARRSQPALWTKGSIPETEHYSILRPEVSVEGGKGDLRNDFKRLLEEYDYIFMGGEAETHCVLETVSDLVELLAKESRELDRLFILRDCMSPVIHPEVDFHSMAVEQFARYEERGVRLVESTDPLPMPQ